MSGFSVFKERLELRLRKYPELRVLWTGQAAVITKNNMLLPKLIVNPAPRPCSVLVAVDDRGSTKMEWLELEASLKALSGEKNA